MRTLLLIRGSAGCGKSTFIKEHGLQQYAVSPDDIRLLCSTPQLNPDGSHCITQERENEAAVWSILWKILEQRMSRGEFTVVDATCSKTKDIQQYKDLCDHYRYRMYIVDMTDVPIDVCKKQNKMRDPLKWVPEEAIDKMYARFKTQPIPGGITVIKPDQLDTILEKPIDLSGYQKIVHIGDIHGCYSTLMQYPDFKDGLHDDICYIFTGDYLDRGNENSEVANWLKTIYEKPNVCLLAGNHERHIRDYGDDVEPVSPEFKYTTAKQLEAGGFTQKDARMLYRKCRQFSHYTYNGLEVLACHGGIPNLSTNLLYVPAKDLIQGVGSYNDYSTIADTWMAQTHENQFLVHGHRNTECDPIKIADRVFNLEGAVEFGGAIRIAELNSDLEWTCVELQDCQPVTEELNTEQRTVDTVEDAISYLRNNKFIQEKRLGDNISSFNFTRQAFFKGNWTKQTVLARGLFINTEDREILARSYEKFFKINEVRDTELGILKSKLVFPVTAYVKENGFLAIVSYDKNTDDLFVASKSTNKGDFVEYIKAQLEPHHAAILDYLRNQYNSGNSRTLVFECIDIEHDPHIIKYDSNRLVLLDSIHNTLDYKADSYADLTIIAGCIGLPVKEKAFIIKDFDAFKELYYLVDDIEYQYNGRFIEGFVYTDSTGFMTKQKSGFYNAWKAMRGVADQTLRQGYIRETGMLYNAMSNLFYGFCRKCYQNDRNPETKSYPYKTDIISMRDKFLNESEDIK